MGGITCNISFITVGATLFISTNNRGTLSVKIKGRGFITYQYFNFISLSSNIGRGYLINFCLLKVYF